MSSACRWWRFPHMKSNCGYVEYAVANKGYFCSLGLSRGGLQLLTVRRKHATKYYAESRSYLFRIRVQCKRCNFCLAEWLSASGKGLYSMKLVIEYYKNCFFSHGEDKYFVNNGNHINIIIISFRFEHCFVPAWTEICIVVWQRTVVCYHCLETQKQSLKKSNFLWMACITAFDKISTWASQCNIEETTHHVMCTSAGHNNSKNNKK